MLYIPRTVSTVYSVWPGCYYTVINHEQNLLSRVTQGGCSPVQDLSMVLPQAAILMLQPLIYWFIKHNCKNICCNSTANKLNEKQQREGCWWDSLLRTSMDKLNTGWILHSGKWWKKGISHERFGFKIYIRNIIIYDHSAFLKGTARAYHLILDDFKEWGIQPCICWEKNTSSYLFNWQH